MIWLSTPATASGWSVSWSVVDDPTVVVVVGVTRVEDVVGLVDVDVVLAGLVLVVGTLVLLVVTVVLVVAPVAYVTTSRGRQAGVVTSELWVQNSCETHAPPHAPS